MKIIKMLLSTALTILSICLIWQGMHELYKYEECNVPMCVILFSHSFYLLFLAEFWRSYNPSANGK